MRQQTKPFTVEIKRSRKLKTNDRKTSFWGKLDLTPDQDALYGGRPERAVGRFRRQRPTLISARLPHSPRLHQAEDRAGSLTARWAWAAA